MARACHILGQCFSTGDLRPPLGTGATKRFTRGHEQRPLINSSAVILHNLFDEQGATSVDSLWKGPTNHEKVESHFPRYTTARG